MAKPTINPANLAAILPLVRQRLADKEVLPASAIYMTINVDATLPPLDGDHDLFIGVGAETPDADHGGDFDDAAGPFDYRVRRVLNVLVRTRNELDSVNDWQSWLTHQTMGHLALEKAVRDALYNWFPLDNGDNALTFEGLGLAGIREPRPFGKPQSYGWGGSVVMFRVPYELDFPEAGNTDLS